MLNIRINNERSLDNRQTIESSWLHYLYGNLVKLNEMKMHVYQEIDWEPIGWNSSMMSSRKRKHFYLLKVCDMTLNQPLVFFHEYLFLTSCNHCCNLNKNLPFSYIKSLPVSPKICSRLILICKSRLIETFRTWQGFLIDFLLFLNHVTLIS